MIPINNDNITLPVVIILSKLPCQYHGMPLHYNTITHLPLDVSLGMICIIFLLISHLVVTLINQQEAVVRTKVHYRHPLMPLLFKLHYLVNGVVLTMIYPFILILIIIIVNIDTNY